MCALSLDKQSLSKCTPEKFFKKYIEKRKQKIIVFDSTKMSAGNKNDGERGTHFCFFLRYN
jgi:hypothetical protein